MNHKIINILFKDQFIFPDKEILPLAYTLFQTKINLTTLTKQ